MVIIYINPELCFEGLMLRQITGALKYEDELSLSLEKKNNPVSDFFRLKKKPEKKRKIYLRCLIGHLPVTQTVCFYTKKDFCRS